MLGASLDVSLQRQTGGHLLGSDLNGAITYLRDSPQKAPPSVSSSQVCYQTTTVAQLVSSPLSPISPAWAAQQNPLPWYIADADITRQCLSQDIAAFEKEPPPAIAVPTHTAGSYLSNNEIVYLSPPAPSPRSHNHDCHGEPPRTPKSKTRLGSASDSHTGLVSPPRSLIGQPQIMATSRQGGPHLYLSFGDSRPASGISASAYSQTPSPVSTSNSSGPTYPGSGVSASRRSSTLASPRSGILRQRASARRTPPQVRKYSNITRNSDLSTKQQVLEDKKDRIRAYHREVGARNRQKEKEERQRFEVQAQRLEKFNLDLVAEEKALAAEKMVLVNELFRHSQCGAAHGGVEEYLAVEANKIVQSAKSRFLKSNRDSVLSD